MMSEPAFDRAGPPLGPAVSLPWRAQDAGGLLLHGLIIAAIVASQLVYTPARLLNADNTWHFRLTRDLFRGDPVYWSAVDAYRLFPDLVFSALAFVLPGGGGFSMWRFYFYVVVAIAIYLSLSALASAMYREAGRRRTALLVFVAVFFLFLTLAPFWDKWLLDPGNHGTGLPVIFACLALVLRANSGRPFDTVGVLAFIGLAALVTASNRLLLVVFLVPLGFAIGIAWAAGRVNPSHAGGPADRGPAGRLLSLTAAVLGAILLAYVAWRTIGALDGHKLVERGVMPAFPASGYLGWVATRWATFVGAAEVSLKETFDVLIGIGVLLAAIAAALGLLVGAARGGRSPQEAENRLIFGLFAAGSAAASLAFAFLSVDLSGAWQFRYLAVAVAVGVVFLASFLVERDRLVPWRPGAVAAVILFVVFGASALASARRQAPIVAEEAAFQRSLAQLEDRLRAQAPLSTGPMRGFSEYWLANDLTARSEVLRIETIEPDKALHLRFYNNNAGHLCSGGHFFILRKGGDQGEPKRADMLAKLGAPRASEIVNLAKFPDVTIDYYDPSLLNRLIVDESKETAKRLFPTFRCSAGSAGLDSRLPG